MNKKLWISVLVLILVDLAITALDQRYLDQLYEFTTEHWITGLSANALIIVASVYMVSIVKERSNNITIFGFFWRVSIASPLTHFIAIFLIMLLGYKFELPSMNAILVSSIVHILLIPIIMWSMFSSNRKVQIIWFYQLFRGMY